MEREKENFIRNYIEQQRVYLSAYCKEGLIGDVDFHRSGSPQKVPNSSALGFDTPILQPRALRSGPLEQLHGGQRLQAEKCSHRAKSLAEREPSRSSPQRTVAANDADKENEKLPTRKRCSNESKKTRTPSSDREHEARLAERRERKRRKREIVRSPDGDGDGCGRRSNKPRGKLKTTPSKNKGRASTLASFALLHGFSATNVKKDRLTLKPSLHLPGLFFKGKASAKTKAALSKKQAPSTDSFSERAFLSKTKATSSKDVADSEGSSSASHQCSHPPSDRDNTSNHCSIPDKDDRSEKLVGNQVQTQELPEEHQSIVWDIESRNGCSSAAQGSPTGSVAKASASVVMDVRTSRWFAPADTGKVTDQPEVISKPPESTPTKREPVPCAAESGEADPVFLHDRESSSLHPSHSASQTEYHQRHSLEGPADVSAPRPTSSRYFSGARPAIPPCIAPDASATATHHFTQGPSNGTPKFRTRGSSVNFQVDSVLGEPSLPSFYMSTHDICGGMSGNYAIKVSSQPPAMFSTDTSPIHVTFAAYEQPAIAPSYVSLDDQGRYEAVDDRQQYHNLNEAISCRPSDGIGFHDCEVPWYSDDTPVVMDDPGVGQNVDFWPESHVEDRGLGDAADGYDLDTIGEPGFEDGLEWQYDAYPAEHDGSVLEDADDYCVWQYGDNERASSVWEDAEDEEPEASNFLEGRTLLFGTSTPSRSRGPSGLYKTELDVGTRLRGHWQRQRL